jgi:hypothetical protein
MKTKKQIFYLRPAKPAPYSVKALNKFNQRPEPTEPLIIWTVLLYDHQLIMPELTILVQNYYCLN